MTGGATGGIVGTFNAILKEEGAATLMKGEQRHAHSNPVEFFLIVD